MPVQLPGLQKHAAIAPTTTIVPAAITTDGRFLYALAQDGVIPVDLTTSRLLPAIKTGAGPRGMAITQDGKIGYVISGPANSVTPISISDNVAGTPIAVGRFPIEVTFTPDGKTAYVGNGLDGTVTAIDVA